MCHFYHCQRIGIVSRPTFINIRLLGVLLRERILHDNIIQTGLLKVLLARLLIRTVFSSVLIHRLQSVVLAAVRVDMAVEEFVCLLANL